MLGLRGVEVGEGVVRGQRVASKAADRISVIKLGVAETADAVKERAAVWTVGADDDDELIDEDELLGEEYGAGGNGANGTPMVATVVRSVSRLKRRAVGWRVARRRKRPVQTARVGWPRAR
jgi:hypothetical protein